jgi:hypothetical protein
MPVALRSDFDALQLRTIARKTKDGPQARRLLALASIYGGATRSTEAAKIGGVTLQIVRDWVQPHCLSLEFIRSLAECPPLRGRGNAVITEIYKWGHLIEKFFGKIKEFKRIALLADKTDQRFAAISRRRRQEFQMYLNSP